MLCKEEIKKMLSEKDYPQVYYELKNEYVQIVFNFAKDHEIEEDNINKLLFVIANEYPKMSSYCSMIEHFLFCYDDDLIDRLDDMISYYNVIKTNFTWVIS